MTTNPNPWALAKEGKLSEAYNAYTDEFAANRQPTALYNRGIVLLNMDRISEAKRDFAQVVQLLGTADGEYLYLGATHWLLGECREALDVWTAGLNTEYTDAAGGIQLPGVLLYGAVRLGDSGLEKQCLQVLKKRWKPAIARTWPAPLAGIHLDHISPDALQNYMSQQPILRARQQCQADFHAAVHALRHGNNQEAVARMQAAASNTQAFIQVEHYLAKGEVKSRS